MTTIAAKHRNWSEMSWLRQTAARRSAFDPYQLFN
jgi:hypothetical protein